MRLKKKKSNSFLKTLELENIKTDTFLQLKKEAKIIT
jgi:hypothetical protein